MMLKIIKTGPFSDFYTKGDVVPVDKKHILSIVNGFEGGKWRYGDFSEYIWNNIDETALSARERKSLCGRPESKLKAASLNLRLIDSEEDVGEGSEVAEIILYAVMKEYFGALPVAPKIYYKQNVNDNAKGADSVHIVVDKNEDDFSIWLGEAKFYNSLKGVRLKKIITSIGEMLGTEKLKKENSIITSLSDLDELVENKKLLSSIKQFLDRRTSVDEFKMKLHVPILLLHECEITAASTMLTPEYEESLWNYQVERVVDYFKRQVESLREVVHLYEVIHFHVIFLPVPSKSKVVKRFKSRAKSYREEED